MDPTFPDILTFAIPAFVLMVAAEGWWLRRQGRAYDVKDGAASMAMGLGMSVSDVLMGALGFGFLMLVWQVRLFDLGTSWPVVVAAFVIGDLKYYWSHRLAHTVRWLWMAHVVHHSSEAYNLTTALRQPWTNHITGAVIFGVPMVLLGFHPALVAFAGALNLLYQFWIHTEAIGRMPRWFEAVFNTPSHHRVHHARNPCYLDRNYAGTLIVWDKLFGTFQPEREDERCIYGTVAPIGTYNPFRIAFGELAGTLRDAGRRGLTLRQRAAYLLARPGWSHDGSRKTSVDIRRAAGV
jgi:sterol desaturase/sphingolipid hydroxylase (fatty acid hydroxylase superfamily)